MEGEDVVMRYGNLESFEVEARSLAGDPPSNPAASLGENG